MMHSKLILLILFLISGLQVRSQTCYVTKTGEKYHMANCSYLQYSKIAYDYQKAIQAGYTACSRCKPTKEKLLSEKQVVPTQLKTSPQRLTAVQCKAKTKAGTRCKRMTKNSSGYCYQHDH
ncbi:MAG: hypothetical protein KDC80_30625 [Saprospiraceae bacterium]|nr:hypothetical protein [Saprospiraceae bacterium]